MKAPSFHRGDLQQTRTVSAIPYHERLLPAFPTMKRLPQPESQEVLQQWEEIGYYVRDRSPIGLPNQLWLSTEGQSGWYERSFIPSGH